MDVATMIDALVAVLLLVTIIYAVMLNRKLGQLRTSRADFEKLVAEFSAAAARTEGGIAALKEGTAARQADLEGKIDRADAIRDELAFMLDRGDQLAGQLDSLIRGGRGATAGTRGDETERRGSGRGLRGFG